MWRFYCSALQMASVATWKFAREQGFLWGPIAFILGVVAFGVLPVLSGGGSWSAVGVEVRAHLKDARRGIYGVVILLAAVFFWYLLSAPVRLIEKQRADFTEQISALKQTLSKKQRALEASHAALERAQAVNTPHLQCQIDGFQSGIAPKLRVADVLLLANITNTGKPSIAHCCTLRVIDPLGNVLTGRPEFIGKRMNLHLSDVPPISMIQIGSKDALYNKVAKPIPNGGMERGWLLFLFPERDRTTIQTPGTKLVLSFQDVLNHPSACSQVVSAQKNQGPMYYPGITQPYRFRR